MTASIVCGDFNATIDAPSAALMATRFRPTQTEPTAFTVLADSDGSVSHPDRRRMDRGIDYIWVAGAIRARDSSPRLEASPIGPTVRATVKWYNPDKGFGFVGLADGSDAFLHVSVVERSGNSSVAPGAILEVRVAPGQKGTQVTEIVSVDASTALSEPPRRPRPERPFAQADQASVEEIGTVKWYNSVKGFGFIVRDRGGKDIFLHASALNRGGLSEVAEGQRVAVDMIEGGKGPEAVSIRLI